VQVDAVALYWMMIAVVARSMIPPNDVSWMTLF
jgi:hypothetical protein